MSADAITAEDVVDHLCAQGIGTKGTDAFHSFVPPAPAALFAVIPTAGWPRDNYLGTLNPTFQIRVRAETHDDALAKVVEIDQAFTAADGVRPANNFMLVDHYVFLAEWQQEPLSAFIGYDANGWAEYSLNLHLKVRRD